MHLVESESRQYGEFRSAKDRDRHGAGEEIIVTAVNISQAVD